jgi:hypothetical protein
MILHEPKRLDSFYRCETGYRLLEFSDGRFAIEWQTSDEGSYAILYDDIHKAADDFNALRMRKLSYLVLEERTNPENILNDCPWNEEGEERIRISRMNSGEFWIIFSGPASVGMHEMRMGPYITVGAAIKDLPEAWKTAWEPELEDK